MASRFATGDAVQTPLGKGVVREIRSGGRLVVEMHGRSVIVEERTVTTLETRRRARDSRRQSVHDGVGPRAREPVAGPPPRAGHALAEVDLHGLAVDEALARTEQAMNDALLADLSELRLIHGRSGGRIRAAVHRRLREIAAVRGFGLDPRNAGVTIVRL